jgi:hypothetical protein
VTGPVAALDGFAVAAVGAATVPWVLDFDRLEEDWFHRLMAPAGRSLSLAGAKILANQIRQAAEHRHDLAVARVGHSRACPFDLHSLVPVPMEILVIGPDQPDSITWLWAHWGTTKPLRYVAVDNGPCRRETPDVGLKFSFWSADWSPWQAVERLRADWPTLSFDLQPRYDRA